MRTTTRTKSNARSAGKWQGMNWIRQAKRLAIYLRDGCACAYCGQGVEQGAQLTLDHVKPHSKGGSNHETNLVTCCQLCNSRRGARSLKTFAAAVAGYVNHGVKAEDVIGHVKACVKRKPELAAATLLILRRGSASKALASL